MKAEPNSSKIESSEQQEQEKEQRRGASHRAGTKSCTNQPQGARERIPRMTRDQVDFHLEEKTQKGKNAISLKGVAREAMKAASAGALSLLGATWKVQKSASSRNQAQGAIKKVTQIPRRREKGQTGECPCQRERGAAPGSQNREEPKGQNGSGSLEEQWGEPAREMVPRQMQAEAREKPRPELDGAAQLSERNRKASGARIRRYTSLTQGAWSRLQREAGNPFNMLKATSTARRHTAGTQNP